VPSVGYGWEPVPQREPQELLPVRSKEGGFHDQERVGTPRGLYRIRVRTGHKQR